MMKKKVKNMNVNDTIKEVIVDTIIGFDIESIKEDQVFSTAGIDSLDHMNLLLAIEEKFDIFIPEEEVEQCSSISGIASYIEK